MILENYGGFMDNNNTATIYTPNTDNLDKVPSCDIFGFLMATCIYQM